MRGKCPKCGHSNPRKRSEASRVSRSLSESMKSLRKLLKSKAPKLADVKMTVASVVKKLAKLKTFPPAKQRTREEKIADAEALVEKANELIV